MKKLLTTLAISALAVTAANAQAVLGYSLEASQGSYTPLDNPTVIFSGADSNPDWLYRTVLTPDGLSEDSGSSQGFSLGFTAVLAGDTYTDFLVAPSGYLYLGNGEISYNSNMGPSFMTYGQDYVNAGFAFSTCDYDNNTKVSYQVMGSGDDRRLVIQFENFKYKSYSNTISYNAQTILYSNGLVKVVFGNVADIPADVEVSVYAGVRHYGNYVSAEGTAATLTTARNDRGDGLLLSPDMPSGLTLTMNQPGDCARPTAQPTTIELSSTSNNINGTFTATDTADSYLVLYTTGDAVAGTPADGTYYKAGEQLGEATVAYCGPATTFEVLNLQGGTDYHFSVYAVNAYGYNGPVYNTESPLTASMSTLPAQAAGIEVTASSLNSLTIKVTSNEADDDVVVLYNAYPERDNYGDHGLFGELPADVKTGDVLPAPADFTPYYEIEGAPMPSNSGIVAYVGKAGEFTVENLEAGTGYYLAVYTRNAAGRYTTLPLYGGGSTYIESPYEGDSYFFPRYHLPPGWSGSEDEVSTVGFVNQEFYNIQTNELRPGTQVIQQQANLTRGDVTNGKEAWLTLPPVVVNDRHCMARFDYCITFGESRFSTVAYNDWAEGDRLQIRLSEDNGETWSVVAAYTDAEHPSQEETLSYVNIAADLNDYRDKTVLIQLYWKTYANAPFGCKFFVDRFSLLQGEFPAVPEVTVAKITHDTAVVSWVSQQTDYELVYNEVGGNVTHTVKVEGASSYTLEGLEPNTGYTVKVRGLLAGEEEVYSEWSDPVVFTTADYPAVDAPENLKSDTETFAATGYVQLSWSKAVDALSYEVAYRLASSTEWIYKNCEENSLLLTELESGENYVWKVRAFCTHDRETSYSAQARFTAPQMSGVADVIATGAAVSAGAGYIAVEGAQGTAVAVYSASGVQVVATASASANERYELAAGLYIVSVGNKPQKVAVK